MTGENTRKNALEDIARADEALSAARHLLAGGFNNDAVSRAYYAAFNWARALLVSKGIQAKTHRGTVQLLGLHFVKTGVLTPEVAGLLAHLATYRELVDYNPATRFTNEEAGQEIARAERFIDACRPLLPLAR
jgi:uncharacterized protein (UPF0332 family)